MKKRVLSLILCLFLIPGALIFTACGDDDDYNLANLSTDFYAIASNYETLNLTIDNEFEFDYSNFVYQDEQYFTDAINTTVPYSYLGSYYNSLFSNSMAFVYDYINVCSTDSIDAPQNLKNELKQNLDDLNYALRTVDADINMVADRLRFNLNSNTEITNESCMSRLKNLFDSYDELFASAYALTDTLAEIYFDYALNDANPNFYEQSLDEFNALSVTSNLNAKLKLQISNLTEIYTELYLGGGIVSTAYTTQVGGAFASLEENYSTYMAQVAEINKSFDPSIASAINGSTSLKQNFYNLAIELYNIQSALYNDVDVYKRACEDIVYTVIIDDVNATTYELMCVEIVDNHEVLLDNYNNILVEILTALGV